MSKNGKWHPIAKLTIALRRSRPMNGFQMNFLFSLGHPGYAHASGTVLEGLDAGVNSS